MDLVLHSRGMNPNTRFMSRRLAKNYLTRCIAETKVLGSKVVPFLLSFFDSGSF